MAITTVYTGPTTLPEMNTAIAEFVSVRLFNKPGCFRDYGAMGVFEDQSLIAGVVFYDWDQDAGVMQLSAASISKRWLTRNVMRSMFSAPFEMYGCQMIVLRVSSGNEPMIRIARRYGFDEYLIPRLGGRHEDQILFTLTDDQWRLKEPSYGGPNGEEKSA